MPRLVASSQNHRVPNAGRIRGEDRGEVADSALFGEFIERRRNSWRIYTAIRMRRRESLREFSVLGGQEAGRTRHAHTMGDRTQFVPSHVGDDVLPNLPFFHKLLRYAQRKPPRIAIRDVNAGLEKTFRDVLSDALALRCKLKQTLTRETLRELAEDKEVYIGLLAPGGYEYTVGFVAIVALGAAVVPMGQ